MTSTIDFGWCKIPQRASWGGDINKGGGLERSYSLNPPITQITDTNNKTWKVKSIHFTGKS